MVASCRADDVEIEAVLGHVEVATPLHAAIALLRGIMSSVEGGVEALWMTESKVAYWWLGEGDPEKGVLIPL